MFHNLPFLLLQSAAKMGEIVGIVRTQNHNLVRNRISSKELILKLAFERRWSLKAVAHFRMMLIHKSVFSGGRSFHFVEAEVFNGV